MFYGLLIRMYYSPKEHGPPHIHVYFQGRVVVINIANCEIMKGKLPRKQKRLMDAWIELHKDETRDGSLLIDSYIRSNMIFTAVKSQIIKKLCEVGDQKYKEVISSIIQNISK